MPQRVISLRAPLLERVSFSLGMLWICERPWQPFDLSTVRYPESCGVKPTIQPWHLCPKANHSSWNSSPPHLFTLPTSSLSVKHTYTCTYKHTQVYTPHTPGEQAGMELVPDFIGGDSFSHFSVWITSSSWAMRGNEHCSTTKSRFRLTELVLRPVGFRCCRTAPLPDRTPTTAMRDWCVCVYLRTYGCIRVCVCVSWWSLLSRVRVGKESDVSGLVRIEGDIRICLALIWHQYLCPCPCFLSLSCHSLSSLDNVFLDYVIGLTTLSTPHPSATLPPPFLSPFLPCLWPASIPHSLSNALDVYLENLVKAVSILLSEDHWRH